MSNFLAVATVTAALRRTLEEALVKDDFGEACVTTFRPGGEGTNSPKTRTNLYLYMVTPNIALRNIDMPNRNSEGNLIQRPQIALDLHYLLTFHGDDEELKPQRLLGNAVRALHDRPILTRQRIRETIENDPRYNTFLQNSNLADALETIKLTPISLSVDELYKLWSVFFQTPYQLSVAYIATVVLIEGSDTPGITLPVRERNLYTVPFHQPVVEKILPEEGAGKPILAESKLYIRGKNLRGDRTLVKINGAELIPESISEKQVTVLLKLSPGLRAGVHGIQIVHQMLIGKPPVPHIGIESNLAAFVLHPAITDQIIVSNLEGSGNALRSADLTIKVKPLVFKGQRIVLLLNEISNGAPVSYTFTDELNDADTDTIKMHVSGVKVSDYLVRVQVDGAQSQLVVDSDPTSQTYNKYIEPKVRIP
ncbi:MAG TPA: DUF4255 domain-containing protein [Oculatellaceae cyanobacterium]